MAKYYPTLSNQMLRKNAAARRTEWQSEVLSDDPIYGKKASKKMNESMIQQRGIRQRYTKQPRMQAIKRADATADQQLYRGREKAQFVSKNWKKFL